MNDHHPIWDRDNALRRLLNNETLLNRVLTLFFEQAENRLGEIGNLISQQKYQEAKVQAHTLKGSAGEVGATRLHFHLSELEKALVNAPDDAPSHYSSVVSNYEAFSSMAR